jgi:PAS domain S-box-containing protein
LCLVASHAASLVLITTTPGGEIVDWSAGAQAMFGWTLQEAVGMPISAIFTAEDVADDIPSKQMAQARADGAVADTRWLAAKDGGRIFTDSELTALQLQDGLD